MNFLDLVKAKRDGHEHSRQEIDFIIDKVMDGSYAKAMETVVSAD